LLLIVLLKQARPLSQILRICQLPQRGSPWQSTRTSSFCQGLSLWERWHGVSRDGEGEDACREDTPSVCSLRSQPAPPRGRLMAMPEALPPLLKPSPWGRWLDAKRQDGRGIPQFFPSPAMIHPAQPYAVRERCRNSVRRQKGGKQTECRFWGGKVVRFADFDRTFAKDSPPRY